MPKTKHSKLYGLEPEGPDGVPAKSTKRRRPAAGQPPAPDLDAIIGNALGAVLLGLIASGKRPEPTAAPRVDGSKVDAAPFTVRTCGNDGHYLCGTRMVSSQWVFCPYCAATLRAVQ